MEIIKNLIGKFIGGGRKKVDTQILHIPIPTEVIMDFLPQLLEATKKQKPKEAKVDLGGLKGLKEKLNGLKRKTEGELKDGST